MIQLSHSIQYNLFSPIWRPFFLLLFFPLVQYYNYNYDVRKYIWLCESSTKLPPLGLSPTLWSIEMLKFSPLDNKMMSFDLAETFWSSLFWFCMQSMVYQWPWIDTIHSWYWRNNTNTKSSYNLFTWKASLQNLSQIKNPSGPLYFSPPPQITFLTVIEY